MRLWLNLLVCSLVSSKEGIPGLPTNTESLLHSFILGQPEHGLHCEQGHHHEGDALGHCMEKHKDENKVVYLPILDSFESPLH